MAWVYSKELSAWTGISTETKPLGVERNERSIEYDTQKSFIFDGADWVEFSTGSGSETDLTTVEGDLTDLKSNTDGLETKLDSISSNTDDIETKLDSIKTNTDDVSPIKLNTDSILNYLGLIEMANSINTGYLATISDQVFDVVAKNINDGNFYTASYSFLSVAQNGYGRMHIKSPTAKKCYFKIFATVAGSNSIGKLSVALGATYSSNGTSVTPVNANFSSANTSGSSVWHTPTVTDPGTEKYSVSMGYNVASNNPQTIERVLTANTDMFIQLANLGFNNSDLTITIEWYEV